MFSFSVDEFVGTCTFPHPPVLRPAALEMLTEELKHVLQALADDITGVSGTGPAGIQFVSLHYRR